MNVRVIERRRGARGASLALALVAVVTAAASACANATSADSGPPARACGLAIWHKPASSEAHVEIAGAWNGWKRPGIEPERRADGWRVAGLDLPPGEVPYAIIEDGVWLTDRNVPMTDFHDGREVSLGVVPDCSHPALRVDGVEGAPDGHAVVRATFFTSSGGARLDPASVTATARDGRAMTLASADPATGQVRFEMTGVEHGKYTFLLAARDDKGGVAETANATVWIEDTHWEPRDAIVYQIVLDRFRGNDGPLKPPERPSDRAGGTLAGARQALESGELAALGVNTIWLSPLYKNPTGEFPGKDGRPYSSYHGYWPTAWRELDPRVASEADLDGFMRAAHARGVRVLFDVVPNHVHQEHAWAREHADWFKPDCVCGEGSCDWGTHIKTCWFAPYLPDIDWTNAEAARATASEVMWWFDRWDADGLRIDAVPMMPRAATRRIVTSVRQRYEHPGHPTFVLGENFTGPGGYQLLRYDLGPFGLDGSFHFPLMWTLRAALAAEAAPLSDIEASFRAGEAAWDGSGAVMGLIIGNHDVSRFASESAGMAGGDTWSPAPQPTDPEVYAKQRVALATMLTLPGAPVIYYGDEVGLAGKSDPDCRRVMPAEAELTPDQIATRELARKVGRARACSPALRRGTLRTLLAEPELVVFARELDDPGGGETAIVALSRRPLRAADLPLPPGPPLVDVVTGQRASGTLHLPVEPFGVHVYVRAGGGCESP